MRDTDLLLHLTDALAGSPNPLDARRLALEVVCDHLDAAGGTLWARAHDGEWHAVEHYGVGTRPTVLPVAAAAMIDAGLPSTLCRLDDGGVAGVAAVGAGTRVDAALEVDLRDGQDASGALALTQLVAQLLARTATVEDSTTAAAGCTLRPSHGEGAGLESVAAFRARLARLVARPSASPLVAVVAVDGLRAAARSLGSGAGDALLAEVGARLRRRIGEAGFAARLADGDFAVATAEEDACPEGAERLGARVVATFDRPFEVGSTVWPLSASAGVAIGDADTETGDDLLRAAAEAVEVARSDRTGRRVHVFDPGGRPEVRERLALEVDLRRAVVRGDLTVRYQPVVELATGRMVATEALVRWRRPGHGDVPPSVFVPIAERLGLVDRLGSQVLLAACAQLAAWRRRCAAAEGLTVAVNVSAAQLGDPNLVATVREALRRSGVAPADLTLELTESAVPTDDATAIARLQELRASGVTIAIDDFGTGYSTLSRLRELPVDVLKVDRSFFTDTTRDAPILAALFGMARTLGMRTVAEGIETPAQLQSVLDHRADQVQGYLFSRPLDPDGIVRLLEEPAGDAHEEPTTVIALDVLPDDEPTATGAARTERGRR